jgi:glycosyltransferase involved in cell wall biosynthesis
VASLFLGCSFFALPSRADEGLPVVCAEAMAAGKAVVAARAGGTPEAVLDGESGVIFEKEDRAALTAALRNLAADPGLCGRFGEAGARRSEQFSWPVITGQYLAAYHDAAHRTGGPFPTPEPVLAAHD